MFEHPDDSTLSFNGVSRARVPTYSLASAVFTRGISRAANETEPALSRGRRRERERGTIYVGSLAG